ncbi:MAG: hypothetical protein AB1772_11155 [Candidatus Zixiibacteriota bacterium]
MLDPGEKAYFQALQALSERRYQQAAGYFDQAAEFFGNNQEFLLLRDTTRLLLEVKREIAAAEKSENVAPNTEEILIDG